MTERFITNSADATIVSSPVVGELVPAKQTHRSTALALRTHWPEYLMESAELALFMISACVVTAVLELIHSKWGRRSGAHMNPAFTLMFLRLGKIEAWDAAFYAVSQFAGGAAGVLISLLLLGPWLAHPEVNFAATQPGMSGILVAFTAELLISFVLALTVLVVSNHSKISRFTPFFAASLVTAYITFEAPFSGMSMNPARTLGSALPAHMFHALWIYFIAPPLAMLIAAELYLRAGSARSVYCAKFHHANNQRCIFRCRYMEMKQG